MALAFLLLVFLLVVALIALFVFPPTRWAAHVTKGDDDKGASRSNRRPPAGPPQSRG